MAPNSRASALGTLAFLGSSYLLVLSVLGFWESRDFVPAVFEVDDVPRVALNFTGIFSFSSCWTSSATLWLSCALVALLTSAFPAQPSKVVGSRLTLVGCYDFFFLYFVDKHAPGMGASIGPLLWTNAVVVIVTVGVISYLTSRFFYQRMLRDETGAHPAVLPPDVEFTSECPACGRTFDSRPRLCSKCGSVVYEVAPPE
ncbi:MAG: hypothetical protein ACTSU5_13655 [Promethearchaeota archaeon]